MDQDSGRPIVDSDALERSLRAALRVEPSPEFLARVRSRIAEEPASAGWTLGSIAALAGAAAVILVMALVASRSSRPQAPAAAATSVRPVTTPSVPAKEVESSRTPPVEPVAQRAVTRRPRRSEARPRVPGRDDDQALREFLTAVDRGAVTLAIPPVARSDEDRSPTVANLTIPPISIAALVVDPIAQ
jgi:hypothetical protein